MLIRLEEIDFAGVFGITCQSKGCLESKHVYELFYHPNHKILTGTRLTRTHRQTVHIYKGPHFLSHRWKCVWFLQAGIWQQDWRTIYSTPIIIENAGWDWFLTEKLYHIPGVDIPFRPPQYY